MTKISINEKYDLVAETYRSSNEEEIVVCLKEKTTGLIHQDICLVRPSDTVKETLECLVWRDGEQEDYTDKFQIKIWDGEE